MSAIFAELVAVGLEPSDIGALERLDDPVVRRRLGTSTSDFLHSDRKNVIAYLRAWAAILEETLAERLGEARPAGDAARGRVLVWEEWLDDAELPAAAE